MYLALYRKYRPRTFRDVISQEHITTTLENQLRTGQLAHAYLFTGTRGTGKTTCAKILAKAINCLDPKDGNPCLECEACRRIDEGSTDIVEIDAASNNSVDDVRNLRDEIVYTPIDCKYKVYIIDEVHMLSASAFNALLKTIEEPPSHIVFILATTDVHKVPATILSRCQRYQFRKIDVHDSAKRLIEIAEKEGAELDGDAALLISRLSDGAMRDALSLLDQCLSVSKKVNCAVVRECSGTAGNEYVFEITDAVLSNNSAVALRITDELINMSKDMVKLCEELIAHFRNLMLLKVSPGNPLAAGEMSADELSRCTEQAGTMSLEQIMRGIDILADGLDKINRMKQTGQSRLLTEMTLIHLCSPKLDLDERALSSRIDAIERKLREGTFAAPAAEKPVAVKPAGKPAEVKPQIEEAILPEAEIPLPEEPPEQEPEAFEAPAQPVSPAPKPKAQPKGAPIAVSETKVSELPPESRIGDWAEVVELLPVSMRGLLSASEAYSDGAAIIVRTSASARAALSDAERSDKLRSAAGQVLGNELILFAAEEPEAKKIDKTALFLEKAKENGIPVKLSDTL